MNCSSPSGFHDPVTSSNFARETTVVYSYLTLVEGQQYIFFSENLLFVDHLISLCYIWV